MEKLRETMPRESTIQKYNKFLADLKIESGKDTFTFDKQVRDSKVNPNIKFPLKALRLCEFGYNGFYKWIGGKVTNDMTRLVYLNIERYQKGHGMIDAQGNELRKTEGDRIDELRETKKPEKLEEAPEPESMIDLNAFEQQILIKYARIADQEAQDANNEFKIAVQKLTEAEDHVEYTRKNHLTKLMVVDFITQFIK